MLTLNKLNCLLTNCHPNDDTHTYKTMQSLEYYSDNTHTRHQCCIEIETSPPPLPGPPLGALLDRSQPPSSALHFPPYLPPIIQLQLISPTSSPHYFSLSDLLCCDRKYSPVPLYFFLCDLVKLRVCTMVLLLRMTGFINFSTSF